METVCFDTYAWVEYFKGTLIGKKIAKKWVDAGAIISTPAVVLTEIEAKALAEGKNAASMVGFIEERGAVIAIDKAVARRAARGKTEYGLHTVDALVYAAAAENSLLLVTGDQHLTPLPNVIDVKKI